ncbi:MAG TPA: hypothetical protein VGK71_08250 [Nitrospirota bacterium]
MRLFGAVAAVLVFLGLAGCAHTALVPAGSKVGSYDDGRVKLALGPVDDSRISLEVSNMTAIPLRVTWGNSRISAGTGPEEKAGFDGQYKIPAGEPLLSTVNPGESVRFEVFPASRAFKDKKGRDDVYPLFKEGDKPTKAEERAGRPVALKLVMEVDEHTMVYPLSISLKKPWYSAW